jgi:hypothetical protein
MKQFVTLVVCVVLIGSGFGCSYHRAYVSYSKYEEDVQVATAGWDGRRLGPVSAREVEDTRKVGGTDSGESRWIPRSPSRTTADATCRKKWAWILVWPVLATPAFQSARVEAVAYSVPDTSAAEAGLYLIPEDASERTALVRRIVNNTMPGR